jgi:SHS2 domain-containing protein
VNDYGLSLYDVHLDGKVLPLSRGVAIPVPYHFFDHTGDMAVALSGGTLAQLFGDAAVAFTDTITALDRVDPKRPEEVDVDAPELDLLLVDFLSELLYRFDTRGWLTRVAEMDVHEKDGGWSLQGTLRGERLEPTRHDVKILIKAVTYHGLHVRQADGLWTANVVFDI